MVVAHAHPAGASLTKGFLYEMEFVCGERSASPRVWSRVHVAVVSQSAFACRLSRCSALASAFWSR